MMIRTPSLATCLVLVLGTTSFTGCRIPQPISIRTHVVSEPSPPIDSSPIVQMPVGGGAADAAACGSKVGIVDVDGILVNKNQVGLMSLGGNPVADFRAKLDYARSQPELRALVIRINSPGGGVTATDIMWQDLERFKADTGIPVIACLMDVGAGGAYYLATAADIILAHPTTVTGGFGVILNLYNMEDMLAQMNIVGVPVKAGSHVDIGSPLRRIPEDSRQILQEIADDFQQRFRSRIELSRGLALSGEEPYLDGRILTAARAQQLGLIDGVSYLDDAIRLAADQARCPAARPVLLHRCKDRAETAYAITPNRPIQGDILPIDVPGLHRSRLPTFLYMWQPNPTYAP